MSELRDSAAPPVASAPAPAPVSATVSASASGAPGAADLGEFGLIARYFARPAPRAVLGGGDDCALLPQYPDRVLAVSTDMLVAGRHFFPDAEPRALGHKALAVNLSDLAAMGATPRAFTLALALPAIDTNWLDAFSAGMLALADASGCELVGGDTTRGPLTISITVMGDAAAARALRRDAARAGDDVWVSGSLGDARLALGALRGEWTLGAADLAAVRPRLDCPEPRLRLGIALADLEGPPGAAIDVSDGLAADLGHLLSRSGVGATIDADALPVSATLAAQPAARRRACALAGGDDYELCFTAPAEARARVAALAGPLGLALTRIGRINAQPGLRIVDREGQPVALARTGFDHFSTDA